MSGIIPETPEEWAELLRLQSQPYLPPSKEETERILKNMLGIKENDEEESKVQK